MQFFIFIIIVFIYLAVVEPLRPFIGLLYQPWKIDGDDCGVISEMKVARETEVLGGNLSKCRSVHQGSHMT
jgi:hypothetical protein